MIRVSAWICVRSLTVGTRCGPAACLICSRSLVDDSDSDTLSLVSATAGPVAAAIAMSRTVESLLPINVSGDSPGHLGRAVVELEVDRVDAQAAEGQAVEHRIGRNLGGDVERMGVPRGDLV